ncbi:Ribonuclease P protein component [Bienertia sinuspersici]
MGLFWVFGPYYAPLQPSISDGHHLHRTKHWKLINLRKSGLCAYYQRHPSEVGHLIAYTGN